MPTQQSVPVNPEIPRRFAGERLVERIQECGGFSQGNTSVANFPKLLSIVVEAIVFEPGRTDIIKTFGAPVGEFISENKAVQLINKDVLVLLEACIKVTA